VPSKSDLPVLARELSVPERTLRRAVARGTVRSHRSAPRQFEMPAGEREYLREHWPLLSDITAVLRTERNVRLAVVFGSVARGSTHDESDVDILVSVAADRPLYLMRLAARLESVLDREVDVLSLERLRAQEPRMLGSVLQEGRPLIDRDGQWSALQRQLPSIKAAGARRAAARHRRASAAVAELTGER
jgi:predicted nucleotidyltransferase